MSYNVTSWFQSQLSQKHLSPVRQFLIGTSDYSERVMKWPRFRQKWNDVRAQTITIDLANEDQALNVIRRNKGEMESTCSIKFGLTHPTSGTEYITLYSGKIDKMKYADGACTLHLADKFRQLGERVVGNQASPVTFTDSTLPSDIAWILVTSYGGYSNVQSSNNTDIDFLSWQSWAAVFSGDSVFMNAHLEDKKITEVLQTISRQTQSAIYVEDNRLVFRRFTDASSSTVTIDESIVQDLEIDIDGEDIVNRQYVYGAYSPTSNYWAVQVYDVASDSLVSYGPREQLEKDDAVWFVNSVSALNLAQRIIVTAGQPYDHFTAKVPLHTITRQMGDSVTLVNNFHSVGETYRIMGFEFDSDEGTHTLYMDNSQLRLGFHLDVSTLDGTLDVLL